VNLWLIGLEFNKNEGVKVDLTLDIQNFTDVGQLLALLFVDCIIC
jgi:hypothetical protein